MIKYKYIVYRETDELETDMLCAEFTTQYEAEVYMINSNVAAQAHGVDMGYYMEIVEVKAMNESEALDALYQRDQGIGVPCPETEGGGMKVKQFDNEPYNLEPTINKWLEDNEAINIVDIKYAMGVDWGGSYESCLIFYKEVVAE